MFKTNIIALQEIGEEKDNPNYQYDKYHSGDPKKREEDQRQILQNLNHSIIIPALASILDLEDEGNAIFYTQVERIYDSIPVYDMKIVLGDFSAK